MGAPHPDSRRLAVTQRLLWLCNPLVQQAWEKSGPVVLLGRGSLFPLVLHCDSGWFLLQGATHHCF